MKSYDLNLLVALEALLASGSVTAAAKRMHLSTPAMSHTLARIRETVGDPILVRAGRKLVPTPRALALVEPLSRLLSEAHALLAPPASHNLAATRRHFVIRAPDGIAVVFGAALAEALEQDMPLASLQFLPEGHSDSGALREARIDLDIGVLRDRDPEAEILLLSEQPLMGAVRPGHPLLQGELTMQRFAAERHVAMAPRPRENSPVDEALARSGLTRFVALTVPNGYAALVAASRSQLVACVPERMARGMQASLALQLFELPLPITMDPVVMAWHPRHNADPAHRWLRGTLQRVLADSPWLPSPLLPLKPLPAVQLAAASAGRMDVTPDTPGGS